MRKNTLITKAAAVAMAGALAMSMGGMTAFADETESQPQTEGDQTETPATTSTLYLTKTVTTDGKTYAPNTTFNFTVTPETSKTDMATDTTGAQDFNGVAGGLTLAENGAITFAPDAAGENGAVKAPEASYSKTLSLTINDSAFKKNGHYVPGKYYYTISETTPTTKYPGVGYDTTSKEVIVYVYEDEAGTYTDANGKKYTIVLTSHGDNGDALVQDGKAELTFTNTYGKTDITPDPENPKNPDEETYDLKITKEITGNLSSPEDKFEVTIAVNGDNTSGQLYYVEYTEKGVDKTASLINGTSQALSIYGNDTITIHGITNANTVSVDETDKNGYTATYAFEGGTATDTAPTGLSMATNKKESGLVITNTKSVTTPTGIVKEYAPYILLVAAAGAFAALFLRKKREEI